MKGVRTPFSSPEPSEAEEDRIAEQFGTPPIRHSASQRSMERMAGTRRQLRKLPSHAEVRRDKQGRRSRHLTSKERQKERLDARAFKELDTTLQVLGIDGSSDGAAKVTASPHAPLLPAAAAARAHKPPLQPGSARAFVTRASADSSASFGSDGRGKARSGAGLELRRSSSPQTILTRASSRADSLQDERQRWHEGLDNLLLGNLDSDDLQVALSLAAGKANDLKEQLIWWQTPPEGGWRGWEERIEWLHQANVQLKDVTTGLQQHGVRMEHSEHTRHYRTIREVVEEMCNMSEMCCGGIADGLQALKEQPQELHRGFRAACRIVHCLIPVTATMRMLHASDAGAGWDAFLARSAGLAARVVAGLADATADLQASLLQPAAMSVSLGRDTSAHEVSERCKQLQFAWHQCAAAAEVAARTWPEQAAAVNCAWCRLMLGAAQLAERMQHSAPGGQRAAQGRLRASHSGLSDDSVGSYAGQTGVWGLSNPREPGGGVSDEELQAQAWLPACLTALLANAEAAANAALGCVDGIAPLDCPEGGGDCPDLVRELSEALYELALTGERRVAAMCAAPSALACWALELLEEQACQAVVFVRDLDRSVLGCGENGLVHYATLRTATDAVVNSILRVRRLLKQKRGDGDGGDALPRPLPVIRTDSQSSLTAALRQQAAALSLSQPPPQQPAAQPAAQPAEERSAPGGEAPAGRRQHHRRKHRGGAATPPIPEDSHAQHPHPAAANGSANGSSGGGANGLSTEQSGEGARQTHARRQRKQRRPKQQLAQQQQQQPEVRPLDPFATPEAQAGVSPLPSGAASPLEELPAPAAAATAAAAAAPLAVFGATSLGSSNSLVPAGSSSLFTFGSFSAASPPSKAAGGPPPPLRPLLQTGAEPPLAAGQAQLQAKAPAASIAAPEATGAGTPHAAGGCQPVPARRPAAVREALEPGAHPMSDPTNGYQLLHNYPSLSRVSGEALRRQESSDGSGGSSCSRTESLASVQPVPPEPEAAVGPQGFKLPWEGDPFWQIKWEDLQPTLVRMLGRGSCGEVYEAYIHRAPMAVKFIRVDNCEPAELQRTLLRFKQEVDLQRRLSLFNHIVRFQGACCHIPKQPASGGNVYASESNVQLAIVMELCRFGTLFKVIEWARKASQLPPDVLAGAPARTPEQQKIKASPGFRLYSSWQLRLELAKHAAAALEYMHSCGVIHRDLTSLNVLCTDKFEAKVADFNLSRAFKGEMIPSSGLINSPEWAAPERLTGQAQYNGPAADVFSFGVILWELVTLAWPWHEPGGSDGSSLQSGEGTPQGVPSAEGGVPEPDGVQQQPRVPLFMVMQAVPRGVRLEWPPCEAVRPPFPELPQLVELANACWRQNPIERPTMTEVCKRLDEILEVVRSQARERRRARQPLP